MAGRKIVVLGTGGTIAGRAAGAQDAGYLAAQLGVGELLAGVAPPAGFTLHAEQVAQVDSKDMELDVWRALAGRCAHWLADDEVAGLVVTHGTDTLEETAYLLHRVLAAAKPVVLTGAMRPATAAQADGPRNLGDALAVAASDASGVGVVFAGQLHSPLDVYKEHSHRLDAFSSGEAGPLGTIDGAGLRMLREWPPLQGEGLPQRPWPRVEIVTSHAGASGRIVDALLAQGVDGIVAAGTGNGTLHRELEAALLRAQAGGVKVVRSTRCVQGGVIGHPANRLPHAGALSPAKARVALLLELMR